MIKRVAIIGGGPAGCALACFLAERDIECIIFDDNKRPALIVGESLIPAAIPILRRLGVEQEVASFSELKKGAALRHASGAPRVDFAFQQAGRGMPDYAYNIPRAKFDHVLRKRAQALGARFVEHRAKVVTTLSSSEREIELSDLSLAAAGLDRAGQPDLLIDATGRKRLFSRQLDIDVDRGLRNDIAHFAHFENYESDSTIPGQIVISVLDCGWSWQIPLPGRTSVGVVFNNDAAKSYGKTAAERLENVMRENSVLNKKGFRRISEAMTYSNYQLISKKASGKGWILLGDAFGFVDPMLSPGVFMSLESASRLDELVFKNNKDTLGSRWRSQLIQYEKEMRQWHESWSKMI
jgi:flavin-dependent dehydrogenase